jgi:hypothetical protein
VCTTVRPVLVRATPGGGREMVLDVEVALAGLGGAARPRV